GVASRSALVATPLPVPPPQGGGNRAARTFATHAMCLRSISRDTCTRANKNSAGGSSGRAAAASHAQTSRAELLQARFDVELGVSRVGGFDLHPQAIAALDIGLQNLQLLVAHLIDHRSLQIRCSASRTY